MIKLTEQVETKTGEEDEDVLFKMCVIAPLELVSNTDIPCQARKALPFRHRK